MSREELMEELGKTTEALPSQSVEDQGTVLMDPDPPFLKTYKALFDSQPESSDTDQAAEAEECELPLIDLSRLNGESEAEQCKRDIMAAASEWGFFQLGNHGVSSSLLDRIRELQANVFRLPFEKKASEKVMDLSPENYRWGTPRPISLRQLSWSEAYHIPLTPATSVTKTSTRHIMEEFSTAMSWLAHLLAGILAEGMGHDGTYITENCTCDSSYLRLNRYPPCPVKDRVFGLVPHTDTSFLTIVRQDQVGGLQLMKDGRWITVKPNADALIVNIGDLFQAWSNGVYKSVEHRVMSNPQQERFSVAYFLCPSYDTVIRSLAEPAIYRKFSFGEYRQQVQEDVRGTGHKVGLARFLAQNT
ncbi:gibberellin 2-beta-dioxygenase 8-like [Phoenix dactylifera]|uniref:Gibberellin 2-beta-dioxygenase 8 n=1 Tax=Phoenix dactylifera TaxID=42345 RepID=A0A8B9A0G7_PHODC|nr:gibberellin 2-beta-dioxygenase 8 [Phoenix dactylifera]XP_038976964.1 gibberellin 2-beta-dioxygenase 8-like [Phoenix dactylifera]